MLLNLGGKQSKILITLAMICISILLSVLISDDVIKLQGKLIKVVDGDYITILVDTNK